MALTHKQQRFVSEYLVDGNAAAAYRRAGYKADGHASEVNASRLLRNAGVAQAVRAAEAERSRRTGVTADRVARELALVAFGRARDAYREDGTLRDPSEWGEAADAALAGVETLEEYAGEGEARRLSGRCRKVRRWDKVRALELLGKHLGMFVDRHEVTGKGGGEVVVKVLGRGQSMGDL